MTITLGWWIVPALITVAALLWAMREERRATRGATGYAVAGAAAIVVIAYMAAVIVAGAAWFLWAVL